MVEIQGVSKGWRAKVALPTGWLAVNVVYVRARVCRCQKLMQLDCTEGFRNVDINTHTSSAPASTKEERARRVVQIAGNVEQVRHVVLILLATWSSTRRVVHILGFMGLEMATSGGCAFGCMVLGIGGCAVLWCNPSNVHSLHGGP